MDLKYKLTVKDVVYLLVFFGAIAATLVYDIRCNDFSGAGRLIEGSNGM